MIESQPARDHFHVSLKWEFDYTDISRNRLHIIGQFTRGAKAYTENWRYKTAVAFTSDAELN